MSGLEIRERLLSKTVRRIKEINCPDIGIVWIQSLTERERAAIEVAAMNDPRAMRAHLIQSCVVAEDGLPLFGEADIEQILQIDSQVTGFLSNAINDHCEIPAAVRGEGAVKNS